MARTRSTHHADSSRPVGPNT